MMLPYYERMVGKLHYGADVIDGGSSTEGAQQPGRRPIPLSPPAGGEERKESIRVLTAVRLHWPWLVIAALLGAGAGNLAARGVEYKATSTLQLINTTTDSQRTKQDGQTVKLAAESSPVLSVAARARNIRASDLATRVSAAWVTDTELVTVSVTSADPRQAVANANAVTDALVQVTNDALTTRLTQVRDQAATSLRREVLDDPVAEAARRTQLGTALALQQSAAAASTNTVVPFDRATAAQPAGLSRTLSALFGAVGAMALAAVAAVLSKNRRRRIRSRAELVALAPELVVRTPDHAGEFAARLLDTGRTSVVVLNLAHAREAALDLAGEIADELRGQDRSVALVDATSSPGDRRRVLRRDSHRDVQSTFGTDLLVTALEADDVSLGWLSGQSAMMVILVAQRRYSSLQQVRRCVAELASASPSVVLAG